MSFWKAVSYDLEQCCKSIINNFRRHTIRGKVILTAIDHNLLRLVWDNYIRCIPDRVRQAGATKAAINYGIPGKIALNVCPPPE